MSHEEERQKLKRFVRDHWSQEDKCKILSLGAECECLLCCIDNLHNQQTVIADLTRQLEKQKQYTEDHLLTIEGLRSQLAEAKEANERLSKAVDGFDRNTVRLSSELSIARELISGVWDSHKANHGGVHFSNVWEERVLDFLNSLKQKDNSQPSNN